ncbi:hypothetical protein BO82DRAFT_367731 [Aspergillus uvarum CBS 121591]|uniref:Uncharacterized protein n=1 Tax=Aspergillus uvarum CBS 121591 TaxID=1448315 RepID=A0A319CHY7_9EURO|nr:hypothetical protein BO82DRAFT_367731 [Aspergillus uvarum CBS 121591]PYH78303.1 hypothetical protein BO82DRAFT_367731 [Aspergillus uvarum CBS 121591]
MWIVDHPREPGLTPGKIEHQTYKNFQFYQRIEAETDIHNSTAPQRKKKSSVARGSGPVLGSEIRTHNQEETLISPAGQKQSIYARGTPRETQQDLAKFRNKRGCYFRVPHRRQGWRLPEQRGGGKARAVGCISNCGLCVFATRWGPEEPTSKNCSIHHVP